jgi:hypothetical protein
MPLKREKEGKNKNKNENSSDLYGIPGSNFHFDAKCL